MSYSEILIEEVNGYEFETEIHSLFSHHGAEGKRQREIERCGSEKASDIDNKED